MTTEAQRRANEKQNKGRVSRTFHVNRSDYPELAEKLERQKGNAVFKNRFFEWVMDYEECNDE